MKAEGFTKVAAIVAVTFVLALAGCATAPPQNRALLTYKTVPDGAELFEGGKSLGPPPVTRTYLGDGKSNSIQTPDVTAVWPSGAKTSFYTILTVGDDRVATLQRPVDAPGLQADLDHAQTLAATREREAERIKAQMHSDQQRASARCKEQQAGRSLAVADDCN
jgi:hypothetical protein